MVQGNFAPNDTCCLDCDDCCSCFTAGPFRKPDIHFHSSRQVQMVHRRVAGTGDLPATYIFVYILFWATFFYFFFDIFLKLFIRLMPGFWYSSFTVLFLLYIFLFSFQVHEGLLIIFCVHWKLYLLGLLNFNLLVFFCVASGTGIAAGC